MVTANTNHNHSDSAAELENAFKRYMSACYSGPNLSVIQILEVRQAFFSGIHWLNTHGDYDKNNLYIALRQLLKNS